MTLVRNVDKVLPLKISRGSKVLAVTLFPSEKDSKDDPCPAVANELERRGFEVIRMTNPTHYRINEVIDSVDAVFICSAIDTTNCSGSSLRLGWNNLMTFWRGYVFKNKKLVFVSFGDPYKLHELPFLKTYVNAYSKSDITATAVIDACFGESNFLGDKKVIKT